MADPENTFNAFYDPFRSKPILVSQSTKRPIILSTPLLGPLLFTNTDSDARDHCANERTFLSWLRLSIYLSVVSVAILISFHLKSQPTAIERRVALPLGIVFFVLALLCLGNGFANYVQTVARYGRRQALVQSGWKTQVVFTGVASVIVGCCVLFLSVDAQNRT